MIWDHVLSRVQFFATPWTIYSPPGSSVHGIFQGRILEWVAISFSRERVIEEYIRVKLEIDWRDSKGSPGQLKAHMLNRVIKVKKEGRIAPNTGTSICEASVAERGLSCLRNWEKTNVPGHWTETERRSGKWAETWLREPCKPYTIILYCILRTMGSQRC